MKLSLSILALALASACASYSEAPADDFARLIDVEGDSLDGYVTADSSRVRPIGYSDGRVRSHVYFRATKFANGQEAVRVVFKTTAGDWLYPTALNFGSPLRSIPAEAGDRNVTCSGGGSSCTHYETSLFALSRADVAWMLSDAAPENIELRLKSRADTDRTARKDELRATLAAAGLLASYGGGE